MNTSIRIAGNKLVRMVNDCPCFVCYNKTVEQNIIERYAYNFYRTYSNHLHYDDEVKHIFARSCKYPLLYHILYFGAKPS